MSKQITIEELVPLLKNGWVAMDFDGTWVWFSRKPYSTASGRWQVKRGRFAVLYSFELTPYDTNWLNSLRRVKNN